VGQTVQYRFDFGAKPAAAIVTDLGVDQVSLHVFQPGHAQPDMKTGVVYSGHPRAKDLINREGIDEGGIWDYVRPQPPQEVDKSQATPEEVHADLQSL